MTEHPGVPSRKFCHIKGSKDRGWEEVAEDSSRFMQTLTPGYYQHESNCETFSFSFPKSKCLKILSFVNQK